MDELNKRARKRARQEREAARLLTTSATGFLSLKLCGRRVRSARAVRVSSTLR